MKIWKQIKYPLLMGLVVLLGAFLRFIGYEPPYWALALFYPLIVIHFLSQGWFQSGILLEILVLGGVFFAVMFFPKPEKHGNLRRYLLRPVVATAMTFILSLGFLGVNEICIDYSLDRKVVKAEQLVAEADEIIYYNLYSQQGVSPDFTRPEFIHTCGNGHDMILIDYDTHKVTFLQNLTNPAYLEIDSFTLKATDQQIFDARTQVDVELSGKGSKFVTHFPDLDNPHRTSGIVLYMADGSVYALTNMIDPRNDYPYFFGLNPWEFDPDQITCS